MSSNRKKCIVVLGIRSGTSMVMGMLKCHGVHLSGELMSSTHENPKGYFELRDLVQLNEQFVDWSKPGPLPSSFNRRGFKNLLSQVLAKHFGNTKVFAIKDPRIVLLCPLYTELLRELNIDTYFIVAYRNRRAVAQSLTQRHKFTDNEALKIAKNYEELAEYYTRDQQRYVLNYETALYYPVDTCLAIDKFIGHELQANENTIAQLLEFVDPQLNRSGGLK